MATATVTISGGGGVSAAFGRGAVVSIGPGAAIGSVPWNTSEATRSKVHWLPAANVPFLNTDGKTVSRPWYLFLQEMAETRMGGITGTPLPAVQVAVQQTQTQVVATTSAITETIAYARSIDAATTAITQVARDNALTGAGSIPPTSDPPAGTVVP